MMKRNIVIMLLFLISTSTLFAQKVTVKGTVTYEDDDSPVLGATVIVKGTTIGTTTDENGAFSLDVPRDAKVLQVAFLGMETQYVAIKPVVNVVLKSDTKKIEEVVVTAQGLTRQQKSLGYATQQIKAEDLSTVRQGELNNALVGKVSGIRYLGGSGARFDEGRIVLRGTTSLTEAGGDEPLYVVDGVITSVRAVNMDDVASVNVLKGPAATALYGARGGNGAIIITTKAPSGDFAEINVSHTLSFETSYLHNKIQDQYGGGYLGADAEMKTYKYNPGKDPDYLKALDGVPYYDYANDASWGPKLDGRPYAPWYAWDITHPKFGQLDKWEYRMNLKDLFRTGVSNTTNLSFARSGKDYMTHISFTNVSRKGVGPNSDATRRFLSVRTMFKPIKRLSVSLDYKYTYSKNHNAVVEGYSGAGNVLFTYQQWGHTNVSIKDLRDYKRPDGTFRTWNILSPTDQTAAYHENPFALYNEINRRSIYQWNVFSADAVLDIIGNLKAGVRVNGNIRNYTYNNELPQNIHGQLSKFEEEHSSLLDIQTQGRLTWNDRFADDRLTLDAAFFIENRSHTFQETRVFTRDGVFLDKFFSTSGSVGLPGGSSKKIKIREQSVYGTATAGWKDTYYLDFSLRNDWTSTLHPDKNSYLYGGLSASVIASQWMKNLKWLDFWKIRASMAQVGSSMDPYNVLDTYRVKDSDGDLIKYGTITNMWSSTNKKDPFIRPTISSSYEVGTEVRILGNRLWADLNFYNRDAKDQIINVDVTPASGYLTRKVNAGLIRNRGIEFSLGGNVIKTKSWDWEINANISKNKNTLVELADGQDRYLIYWNSFSSRIYSYAEVGKPIGVIRGSGWKRDPQGRVILIKRSDPNHAYGPYMPVVETSAQKELGNVQPDFTGGFSTALRFKGFKLATAFDFQIGGSLASATNAFGEGSGLLTSTVGNNDKGNPIRTSVANGGGVRMDGVVEASPGVFEPVVAYVDANYYFQSRKSIIWEDYVYDASYVKMRELSLGYDLPTAWLINTHTGIKAASISFVAQNPWLIYSGVPNIDPSEAGGASYNYLEQGQAVSTRSFGFTVNLTF